MAAGIRDGTPRPRHAAMPVPAARSSKTTFVMTFHDEGVFPFYCVMHQPAMSGQIIVTR